jgi:hypothetical protein
MKRIFFMVLWFFTFAFATGIGLLLIAIGLDFAGFESWGDFLMQKTLGIALGVMPFIGLILGWLGYLPGTKEKKPRQSLTSITKTTFADLKVRLAFIPLIGHWFAPNEEGNDKRDDG